MTTINWNATACTTAGSLRSPIFNNCRNLTTINIGNNVTIIPTYAFYTCNALKNVTIPNSVTSIGNSSFDSCSSLTSIEIPDGVTSIGDSAFYDCHGVTSVKLGKDIKTIYYNAFKKCSAIVSIECHVPSPPNTPGSTPYLFDSSIASNEGFVITVPAGSGDAYKAAACWSQFADKIVESTEF